MRRMFSQRPSPALVISIIALFVSLGGTGYAASQLPFGARAAKKHKAPEKPVTAKQVNKLIATYVSAHHLGATGPEGKQGAAGAGGAGGAKGETGPQGPGAQRIVATLGVTERTLTTIATVGPWTVKLACEEEASPIEADLVIAGPGSISYTTSTGKDGQTATTINNAQAIGGEFSLPFTEENNQTHIHAFLTSGSTIEQIDLQVRATYTFLIEHDCTVTGDAIPIS